MTLLAAGGDEAALAFIEIGVIVVVMAALARLAGRVGITAVPLYLLAGLALGESGPVSLDVSEEFVSIGAEIGVLLLLLALGLEYTDSELQAGLRTGVGAGVLDMLLNATPGVIAGLLLGWSPLAAVLLGGVTWVSSSGIVAKVLSDLGRLGNRETPSILNLLVIEDLAMAVYLPVVAALIVGGEPEALLLSVGIALVVVLVILAAAFRLGRPMSRALHGGNDESLLLAVFGITLLVAGVAQRLEVSGAIGAFLVGLALTGGVEQRTMQLIGPLRDLFAATFFLFFAFQIELDALVDMLLPAVLLALVTIFTKSVTGWVVAGRSGVGQLGRVRAGTALTARGEFSVVIAALGATLADGSDLGALAAGYVLVTAIVGPLLTRYADRLPVPRLGPRRPASALS
ncbi:MAG: cation:proton antiporter [Ilumatobacteraceae bacterium]|nr:cation:proton antiporter [Ilumatobacteraceae bacterium]